MAEIPNVQFPSGYEMDPPEANNVARQTLVQVSMVFGPPNSGKTTLLSSLFELFCLGLVEKYSFAGSDTLKGFEKRCFASRAASGRVTPVTERTPRTESTMYLQLKVRGPGVNGSTHNLLLPDISGEYFNDFLDSQEEIENFEVMRRADVITLLVDGAKLANARLRFGVKSQTSSFLRCGIEARLLDKSSRLVVVFTKIDQFPGEGDPGFEEFDEFLKGMEDDLQNRYQPFVQKLEFHRIAARPKASSSFQLGHGLEALLDTWLTDVAVSESECGMIEPPPSTRGFDRFMWRVAGDK